MSPSFSPEVAYHTVRSVRVAAELLVLAYNIAKELYPNKSAGNNSPEEFPEILSQIIAYFWQKSDSENDFPLTGKHPIAGEIVRGQSRSGDVGGSTSIDTAIEAADEACEFGDLFLKIIRFTAHYFDFFVFFSNFEELEKKDRHEDLSVHMLIPLAEAISRHAGQGRLATIGGLAHAIRTDRRHPAAGGGDGNDGPDVLALIERFSLQLENVRDQIVALEMSITYCETNTCLAINVFERAGDLQYLDVFGALYINAVLGDILTGVSSPRPEVLETLDEILSAGVVPNNTLMFALIQSMKAAMKSLLFLSRPRNSAETETSA